MSSIGNTPEFSVHIAWSFWNWQINKIYHTYIHTYIHTYAVSLKKTKANLLCSVRGCMNSYGGVQGRILQLTSPSTIIKQRSRPQYTKQLIFSKKKKKPHERRHATPGIPPRPPTHSSRSRETAHTYSSCFARPKSTNRAETWQKQSRTLGLPTVFF